MGSLSSERRISASRRKKFRRMANSVGSAQIMSLTATGRLPALVSVAARRRGGRARGAGRGGGRGGGGGGGGGGAGGGAAAAPPCRRAAGGGGRPAAAAGGGGAAGAVNGFWQVGQRNCLPAEPSG